MDKQIKEQWDKFLKGHWQREVPEKIGEYFLATTYGELCGSRRMVYLDPETNKHKSLNGWGGFWWSEPIPRLPNVPEYLLRRKG